MKSFNILFLTLTALILYNISTAVGQSSSCSYGSIDLSPLTLPNSPGTTFYNASGGGDSTYFFNICGEVTAEYCANTTGSTVCQISPTNTTTYEHSCGIYPSQNITWNGSGVVIEYTEGDVCAGVEGSPQRKTIMSFYCSSSEIYISSVSEYSCVYYFYIYTIYACAPSPSTTVTVSASASPSPVAFASPSSKPTPSPTPTISSSSGGVIYTTGGANACNAVKVKSFPSTYSSNTQLYGRSYNASCIDGYSESSQFYLIRVENEMSITASTCGLTSIDTILRAYRSEFCNHLEVCIAVNDDGCGGVSDQSSLTLNILPNRDYYIEVRAFGSSLGGDYSISFSSSSVVNSLSN